MTLSSHQLIPAILWLAPAIQILATFTLLFLASSLRRRLGARTSNAGIHAAFGVVALLLHVGYFLAPLWWRSGRHLLGAATMLPVALLVLGAIVIVLTQTNILQALMRAATPVRLAAFAGAGAIVLAYLGPLVLMLAAST